MEAARVAQELDAEGLRRAQHAFFQYLRRKGMSERFIAKHGEELFGQAEREYASWRAKGNVARSPAGWLIRCGWQRTKDILTNKERRPAEVAVERVAELIDDTVPGPESQAIERERDERLLWAMGYLSSEDRRLLELTYFEGCDVYGAGKKLGWTKSTAHRHHRAALARLRALVPEDLGRVSEADIGLAALTAILGERAGGWSLPGGVEALPHQAREAATGLIHRLGELWRRLYPVTDPSNATAASGAARAAGACGVAAVACLASGVIGPGIGAVDLAAHHHHQAPKAAPVARVRAPAPTPVAVPSPPAATESASPTAAPEQHPEEARASTAGEGSSSASASSQHLTNAQQTQQEFGIEGNAGTPIHSSSGSSSSAASSGSANTSTSHSGGSPSHTSSSGSSGSEFGM